MGPNEATKHQVGDLAEVLDNLGVFGMLAEDLIAPCRSGFRRVPISQGSDYYLSIQGFTPHQIAYAHTHPDSEEWVGTLSELAWRVRPNAEVEFTSTLGAVVGTHAGPGAVGFFWFQDTD